MSGYDESLIPDSITVYIKKGNDIVETLTVTKGTDNKWTYSSSDLPKYEKGTNNIITYTVDEEVPEGFRKVVTDNNISNTYIPKTTTVSGEKVWNLKENSSENTKSAPATPPMAAVWVEIFHQTLIKAQTICTNRAAMTMLPIKWGI